MNLGDETAYNVVIYYTFYYRNATDVFSWIDGTIQHDSIDTLDPLQDGIIATLITTDLRCWEFPTETGRVDVTFEWG